MTKFFKVIIPIILIVAIIASIGWYMFIYDRDFTRDMLLEGARFFERQGNHSVSNWFYDQAYEQASNNDSVAVELAQQHKLSGNYTKAEYVLTKAISDGGSVELYIALCQTYVEQDKILDAVKFLDAVLSESSSAAPEVTEKLRQMRPAAPVSSHEPGFYSQYISTSISCESGTLLVNTNGVYPSINEIHSAEPIALGDGENTIYAVAVSDEGLVSPLAIFGYTIGGVIKEVEFTDSAMEEAIRLHLSVDDQQLLYTNDLWDLTYFTVPAEAQDLSVLSNLIFVEDLAIDSAPSGQLNYLSSLVNLTSLQIRNTTISPEEMKIIGSLPKLEQLTISGCAISSAAGLETATNLRYLDLSNNSIRDLTPITSMANLQQLYLQHNAVNDLSALTTLSALTKLDVSYNLLTNLAPAYNCTSLTYLAAANNKIDTLVGIEKLTGLQTLDVAANVLTDVSPAYGCLELLNVNISSNTIADISGFASHSKMTELNFSRNAVTQLPAFSTDCALITIDGSHNQLTSLDALGGLVNLNNVFMDYNEGISSVAPLVNCPRLVAVKVYGTNVAEVEALLKMDVLVEFDPTLGM